MKDMLKETINPPKEHILEARKMAEGIFKKPPSQQIEMVAEIKRHIRKSWEAIPEEIKEL